MAAGPFLPGELFSDDNARFMQLARIITDLAPKVLLHVLTNHITSNKVFQDGFDNRQWDQEHRKWLASVMEMNPRVQDFSCAAVRNKLPSEWDVTTLSAALSAVMKPSIVPCDVHVNQWCGKKKKKPMEYFEVDVGKSERADCKSWEGFSIDVTTGASPPEVVECVVTEAPSDTTVVAVSREKAKDRDLPKKIKKSDLTEVRPVNLPLPEVQDIVKVRQSRNALYHRSKTKVPSDEFTQCVASVRRLIEQAFPKEDSNGYLAELDMAADTKKFKEWITNGKNATKERQILEDMKEELREQGKQGEELRMGIEALLEGFSEKIEAMKTKLQGLQNVMQCEHADIQRRQEHQLEVTKQGQEVIQCRQDQHVEVTEQVLAVVQGLERGQKYISHQLEPRGAQPDHHPADPDGKAWFSTNPLAQKYLERVRDCYSEMSVTGEYPHVDYIPLRVIKSHPSQHKKEDTVQFLKNFQRATVDFISQQDGCSDDGIDSDDNVLLTSDSDDGSNDSLTNYISQQDGGITSYDPPTSGLLSYAHSELSASDSDDGSNDSLTNYISQQDGGITSYDPPTSGLLSYAHSELSASDSDDGSNDRFTNLLSHDHFLKKQEKLLHIVFGPPGTGKTSFSRHICSQFNSAPQSSSFSLVLLFYLREKRVAEAKTLSDLLSCYGLPDQKLDYDTLSQMIADSKGSGIQIIFDGLDECQDLLKDETSIFTRLLKGELKEAQIVVTSRPGIVTQLSTLWHRASLYEVQGFSHQEVKQYIESFFLKEGDDSAALKLQSALADRPDLTGSTYIPLNLWLICSVFSFKNCTLPDTLTQCYTALFVQLLQRQAMKEGLETAVGDTLNTLPASMLATLDCLSQLSYLCYLNEELVFDEEVVIHTCLSSRAELKATFDGMSLLHVHPKKHGVKDHLTFNFLHSTYQEYLCARHILTAMSEEEQTAFWKENISNPRFAMVFRFYCGLSELEVRGVQEIVKGQKLPSEYDYADRRLLFLLYALHESSNSHLTAAVAKQLRSELTFNLLLSPYDFYVMQYCLSKTTHLRKMRIPDQFSTIYQRSEFAIPCISTVASTNALTSLELGLSSFTLSDAQHLTAALVAVEDLKLRLKESSIEAVEELLLIPTLRQLTLDVTSFNDLQTSPRPRPVSNVSQLDLSLPPEGDTWLPRCIPNCPQLEELKVRCDSKGAGDVVAAALPNLKCLSTVAVWDMNPVPVLQTVGLCGKLQEVSVRYPKHCEPTTEDWCKVSSSVANAQHLQTMYLQDESDINFLQSMLPCLASSQSLQELAVWCDASGAGDVVAAALPNLKCLRKVTVRNMNPVPVLQTVALCGKLQGVSVRDPQHCEPTTEDWYKVSSSVANAQHLQKMDLHLGWSDINFLQSMLPCLASSQSLQELDVRCDASGAGDVVAAALPNLKYLRKVTVWHMNPVSVLQTVSLCGKLQEVSVWYPKHCEPTTEDWCKVSSSVANAQHLQKMDLNLGRSDINFLQSMLPCLASSQSLQELFIGCSTSGVGDVVAAALPNLKCLRKVTVWFMNPVPVLQTVGLCGKLQEVSVFFPKHCEPTTEDWYKVSSSVANAQHLQTMNLHLGWSDINFLQSILPCLASSQSLQELDVRCDASGAGDVVAAALPNLKCLRKVYVGNMNPVPVLQTVGLCGKLQEVSVLLPEHSEPTTEDWCKVSSSVANAQHLQKVDLNLDKSDINFLQSCFASLTSSQSLQELFIECSTSGAGDVVAAALPNLKCLRKVTVRDMNPVPVLQTVGLCGKLQEVSVWYPKHCEPTTEDLCKVSSSVANAQHLQKMDLLLLGRSGTNFLQSMLPCLASSQSLQELDVMCGASGAGEVLADRLLSLCSVENLHIRDIDPAPVLRVLSENAGHCTVSTLGVAFTNPPELGVSVSDMLAKCKSIRSFELYLNKGPKSLAALNYWMEGVRDSSSIDNLFICCLDTGAGPAVAQLLPDVVGRLVKLSMFLPDPTDVLESLQDSSVASLTLVMSHLRPMMPPDQVRLRALVSGVKSGQVSAVFKQEWQFPYIPWTDDLSTGPAEVVCVCAGLSENPHIGGSDVSGVPLCILSEVQSLLKTSCQSVTVNGEALRQVDPSDDWSSDEESPVPTNRSWETPPNTQQRRAGSSRRCCVLL